MSGICPKPKKINKTVLDLLNKSKLPEWYINMMRGMDENILPYAIQGLKLFYFAKICDILKHPENPGANDPFATLGTDNLILRKKISNLMKKTSKEIFECISFYQEFHSKFNAFFDDAEDAYDNFNKKLEQLKKTYNTTGTGE